MDSRVAQLGIASALLATLTTGCSTFHEDARAARTRSLPADSVEGFWEGRWYEADNPKHGGKLRCVLTRTGDTLYRVAARSQWRGIFSASYDATLVLTPSTPGEYLIQGDKDIWPFGLYSITGRVDATSFRATYSLADHQGVMEMQRPAEVAAK
jgi:hypothetical protein